MNWLQHLWLHWQSRRYFRRLQRDDARLMSNTDVRSYRVHAFTVTTTLNNETIVWQLMAFTATAAISTALEFTGPGATLVRCTKQVDW